MHTQYKCESISELRDQQVRFAPREKKIQQIDNAEQLLREIQVDKTYNFEFVCFRITGFRMDPGPIVMIGGEDLRNDLHSFIEDLSDSANLKAEEFGQPVFTVDELSKRFNVSTKTISRWRQQGLVSRKFIFDGGRKRVGFLHTSVDQFSKNNREKVQRGERFSQLTNEDRIEIIDRARRLSRAGGCPAEVTRRIAKNMTRSVETIRYTIKQFDSDNPQIAVFPDQTGPLNLEMKERIYAEFVAGKSAEAIASRYCRTKTTIYRVVNEVRAQLIMDLPLDFMDNDEFRRKSAEKKIVLAPMPESETKRRKTKAPAGLPRYLASLYEVALLDRGQEQYLFRKYNFLKYQATKLRDNMESSRARAADMDKIEALYDQAVKVKNQIVQSNLRLVVSIAKRHVMASEDFFQLVSDGNMSLIRAVEKFDYARGNKFSTYASWAIMKNFARTIPGEFRQKDRFRPTSEELFLSKEDQRTDQRMLESAQQLRERQVSQILDNLDDREQKIIISRFGLDYSQEPQTLKEVGEQLGVTKERIRQIEARALVKLRQAAQQEKLDFADLLDSDN
jgi:RNA polymerase primary sigma factor/RNA polymerase sigma factor